MMAFHGSYKVRRSSCLSQTTAIALMICLFFLVSRAFGSEDGFPTVDDSDITIVSESDVIQKRRQIINHVWGGDSLPSKLLPRLPVIINDLDPITDLQRVERIDTLIIDLDHDMAGYAHHFIPIYKNDRLVIVHNGHLNTFDDGADINDQSPGMRRTIEALLAEGFSVLAVYMPKYAQFSTSIVVNEPGGPGTHEEVFKLTPKTGSSFRYFLDPVLASVNYLTTHSHIDHFPEYSDISMIGFSGGGWTTTLYAAIDTRIKTSYSVAGSLPLYLRSGTSFGDIEQHHSEFYSSFGYKDLYVLGSNGEQRKHIHVLNRNDICCFGEKQHEPDRVGGLSYDDALRIYESQVRQTLINLGNTDLFRIEIDEAAQDHTITRDTIFDSILTELNGGRRVAGVTIGGDLLTRDINSNTVFFSNGSILPNRLSRMAGAPALLRGASNVHDAFFRTPANKLVHVARPSFAWSKQRILSEDLISDPAAASLRAGHFSVVAFKKDYKLHHFQYKDGVETSEIISHEHRGLGQPSILVTHPNQLDVFFKGRDRKLYNARKIGDLPWETVAIGSDIGDFPTAVVMDNGSVMAFIRDLKNELLFSTRRPGSQNAWRPWESISKHIAAPGITGSPSAHATGNRVDVYARTINGRISKFTFATSWTHTDLGGLNSQSPSAFNNGVFTRSAGGNLLLFANKGWIDTGITVE